MALETDYRLTLDGFMQSDTFLSLKPEEKGGFLSTIQNRYIDDNKDNLNEVDINNIKLLTQQKLREYRHSINEPPYRPSQEELQTVALPVPKFSVNDPFEKKEQAWIDWANNNITKLSDDSYRPAEKEDLEVFFNSYANQGIREEAFNSNSMIL